MSLTTDSPLLVAQLASLAARILATLPAAARNDALSAIYLALSAAKDKILAANARDMEAAARSVENGELSLSVLKRLDLGRKGKWEDMLKGILDVQELEDPVGKVSLRTRLDTGLDLERVTCPIGTLLIIFEARPEVIANIASLAIKSGNAAILKGGKESTESFVAISTVISEALAGTQVPNASIQLLTSRSSIPELLSLEKLIDLVIPRGSNELVRYIKHNTRIPVLGHADGLCSIYIHETADAEVAKRILQDAKTGYPAACNAVETLLVDEAAVETVLPVVAESLMSSGVSLRCDARSKSGLTTKLPKNLSVLLQDATEKDYETEFLDLILAVKTIPTVPGEPGVEAAIEHINAHSSHHTDAILARDRDIAERFMKAVDSAGVFWNTSTRMSDGMRFGFGTEVGISTNKIHARGPVGLEGLTTYKYLLRGEGQIAGEYGAGGREWKHERLPL
ncbi:hypothetical protein FGG08_005271 [Glutinoglossum americanum]|uniref:glutamate-5-semialdehyde dehydrogenase n=1 Tax=Glutinoglossum americanum TaxID=1670608 RepID=A0A9P8L315_9PEZI|nr:hypothetical protein FGG08_005271 [Glutinoglossum americanum]